MGDDAVRHAVLADGAGEGAGVDPGQAHHPAPFQPAVEASHGAALGPPVGRRCRSVAEDRPARSGLGAGAELLDVFDIDPHVADVGEGEGDDLAHVGGVGQDLLVAAHGGVEAHLADRIADRAHALALEDGPIREHQDAGGAGHEGLDHGRVSWRRADKRPLARDLYRSRQCGAA